MAGPGAAFLDPVRIARSGAVARAGLVELRYPCHLEHRHGLVIAQVEMELVLVVPL